LTKNNDRLQVQLISTGVCGIFCLRWRHWRCCY